MITKILTSLEQLRIKNISRRAREVLVALGMMFSVMPFVDFTVHADNQTYISVEYATMPENSYTDSTLYGYDISDIISGAQYHYIASSYSFTSPSENRVTVLKRNDTNYYLFIVNKERAYPSNLNAYITGQASGSNVSRTVDDVQYYGRWYNLSSNYFSFYKETSNRDMNLMFEEAISYTFGANAVDPAPPGPSYGLIKDLAYSTSIVGSGTSTGDSNQDIISWYPYFDTNNNISIGWDMEIEIVPGSYSGVTQKDLLDKTAQDFQVDLTGGVNVYSGSYSKGSISISWGRVKSLLANKFQGWGNIFSWFDGQYWNKIGWVYRARYTDLETDYVSDWQTIYTVTSSSGTGVENIISPEDGTGVPDFYQNVSDSYNQTFNTTSVVNNNYNNVFYVNNVPYVVNPSEEDDSITSEELNIIINNALKKLADMLGTQTTIINEGDTITNETVTNNTTINQELADANETLHDYETNFIDSMDTNLQEINTSPELVSNSKFLSSANWVRAQFDRLTLGTPFELVIVFSLVLGIALVLIGKLR